MKKNPAKTEQLVNEVNELRRLNTQLESVIANHKEVESSFNEKTHKLSERIKELNCLYGISALLEKEGMSSDRRLQDIVNCIPPAWQYPGLTCACITLDSRVVKTSNFKKTVWTQQSDIRTKGKKVGSVDVYYIEPLPQLFEGPFLKEERFLLNVIAERLSGFFEKNKFQEENKYLASIIENCDDAIVGKSLDGTIQSWNTSAARIYGYSEDEAVGRNISMLGSPDQKKEFLTILKNLKHGSQIEHFETQRLTKDDRRIYVSLSISPIKNSNGVITGASTIARDITKWKMLEEETKKQSWQLVQADKMISLGTLVAGVAHEINNPLNLLMFNIPIIRDVLKDFLSQLKEMACSDSQRKFGGLPSAYLDETLMQMFLDMDNAASRIAKTVGGLKDFAKKSDFTDIKPLQISTVTESAVRLAQTSIRKNGVDLELALRQDLPQIQGNAHSIEQAVINLITNAMLAVEKNSGKIKVSTGLMKKKNDVYISVSDNGPGIDSAIADTIFDPFVTSRQNSGGTGLGLSISYNIVKDHGGDITFDTGKEKGTIFMIRLPISYKSKKAKILVADDDESMRTILCNALQRSKRFAVETTANGHETCIKIGTYRPDILILDVHMPDMNGLEVCRTIKAEKTLSKMHVLIITGYPESSYVEQIIQLGFDKIYNKPFSLNKFLKDIDSLIR